MAKFLFQSYFNIITDETNFSYLNSYWFEYSLDAFNECFSNNYFFINKVCSSGSNTKFAQKEFNASLQIN